MESKEIALNEYNALRNEILALYSRRSNRLSVVWASLSVLIAASAVTKMPELCCIAIFVCCAGWNDEINWYKGMMKIGSYIKCVLEPQLPGLKWESATRESHKHLYKNKTNELTNLLLNSYFISTLIVLIISLILGVEFFPDDSFRRWIFLSLLITSIVIFITVLTFEIRKDKNTKKLEKYFSEMNNNKKMK